MTAFGAVFGLFDFITRGPVKLVLKQTRDKVVLFFTIACGVSSCLFNIFHLFYTYDKYHCFNRDSEMWTPEMCEDISNTNIGVDLPNNLKDTIERYHFRYGFLIYVRLLGLNLCFFLWSLSSLSRLGPKNFMRIITTFPQIALLPVITPFTYGIMCQSCNCNHCRSTCKNPKVRSCFCIDMNLYDLIHEDLNHEFDFYIMFYKVVFSKSLTGLNLFLTGVADVTLR